MPNSICTTSNTQTTTPATKQATFAIGDLVLCPSLSDTFFVLTADPYGRHDDLTLAFEGSYFRYDKNGYFVCASDHETFDFQPSLFHDTPANQQSINTLYDSAPSIQSSQRKIIDTTTAYDDEIVLITSCNLSNNAGDLRGAIDVLDDMSSLLGLIYNDKISQQDTKSLTRLTQTTVDTWAEILNSQLGRLNEVLALSKFGKVGG